MKMKVTSLLISFALCVGLCTPAFAAFKVDTSAMTKAEFAEYCHSLRNNDTRSSSLLSTDEAEDLLMKHAMCTNTQTKAQIEKELNASGYFLYKDGTESSPISPLSEAADCTISGVIVWYDDNTDTWTMTAGGHWTNLDAIFDDAGFWIFDVGYTHDIGGYDAVGIVIQNTEGKTPSLLSSHAEIYDGDDTTVTLKNPSTYDTGKGIAFEYQDYITVTKNTGITTYDFNYYGYGYSAIMRFDSSFRDWSGTARGFYTHTWSDTTINSIGFNVGAANFGLDISWSENKNKFLAFSNMDTQF